MTKLGKMGSNIDEAENTRKISMEKFNELCRFIQKFRVFYNPMEFLLRFFTSVYAEVCLCVQKRQNKFQLNFSSIAGGVINCDDYVFVI